MDVKTYPALQARALLLFWLLCFFAPHSQAGIREWWHRLKARGSNAQVGPIPDHNKLCDKYLVSPSATVLRVRTLNVRRFVVTDSNRIAGPKNGTKVVIEYFSESTLVRIEGTVIKKLSDSTWIIRDKRTGEETSFNPYNQPIEYLEADNYYM